jgi:hypothetical protein
MRYYCQADINNRPYSGSLLRYREDSGLIYEESWNGEQQIWEPTTWLTRLLTGGDCTLVSISMSKAELLQNLESAG